MAILLLGDGNLRLSAMRAERAAELARATGKPVLPLGTLREQEVMIRVLRDRKVRQEDVDDDTFYCLPPSRNTIGNAQVAAARLDGIYSRHLIIVTHQFHESPIQGMHKVSRIFSAQFPDSQIDLELLPGTYPRQRLLHAAQGMTDDLLLKMKGTEGRYADIADRILEATGRAREHARNLLDIMFRS